MKKITYLLIILSIYSCKSTSVISGYDYKIQKIDSIDNVYLIYADRLNPTSYSNIQTVKIVSKKLAVKCRNKSLIRVGSEYKINIISIIPDIVQKNHLNSVIFENTSISLENNNIKNDIYRSDNIEGLCYKPIIIK